jgi:hypothetical protein
MCRQHVWRVLAWEISYHFDYGLFYSGVEALIEIVQVILKIFDTDAYFTVKRGKHKMLKKVHK